MDKTKISIFDRGFLYGDGIFETMRSYKGKIFRLDEHLSRLISSAKVVQIKIPYSKIELARAIYSRLKKERLKDAYIRITVTRGKLGQRPFSYAATYGKMGAVPFSTGGKPTVVIIVKKYKGYPEKLYSEGISAVISEIRQNELSPLSGIKSLSFLNYVLSRMRAQEEGFDDAILLNTKGYVAEAATSNIFLVKNGRILTPSLDSGILPGVTRHTVIRIAGELGMKVSERVVLPKELLSSDEVFLTNSLAEILPLVRIGRRVIGKGSPGKVTKLLHAAYWQRI